MSSQKTNVYRYDGTNWSEVAGLPAARAGQAAGVLNGALYAIGGIDSGVIQTNVYRYDGTNWTEVTGLPAARGILAAAVLNGALYAVGGNNGGIQANVYRYPWLDPGVTPSSGSWTGGYQVVISGTNLSDGTDVTNVTICGANVASIDSVAGSTQVVVTAGVGTPGLGDVRVYSFSEGESVAYNAFTYTAPVMAVLGTNGAVIASGEPATAGKGTDFGSLSWGAALTNTFAITNSGNTNLTISGVTTSGLQNAEFRMQNVPTTVAAGTASNFAIVFNPSAAGVATASVAIANNSATTPYVVNLRGVVESAPTPNGWLAISVTPETGSWALTAPAGYTGPTSGTGNLAAVSAVTGQYSLAWGALSGYVAPSNQAQFVTGGNTTLFIAVYLQISTNIRTPSGVSATEGTYTNRIRVIWQGVAGATGYEIWRSQTNDPAMAGRIADIPVNQSIRDQRSEVSNVGPQLVDGRSGSNADGGEQARALPAEHRTLNTEHTTYYYDDYAINPINAYYYWVRAKTSSLISPMSYVGMGYAALAPDQKTGTADIDVGDFVYLPVNAISLSHAGTVSCRVTNNGPDSLSSSGVGFDFYMGTNTASMVWIGSAQSNLSLNAGQEALVILKPVAKQGLTVRGDLSGTQTAKVTVRHLSTLNDPNPANNTATAAGTVRIKTSGINSPGRSVNDYDGDGKSDGCLYQSALGRWYLELSGDRYDADLSIGDLGLGWTPVPGDYDGDGLADVAAYESSSGQWLALLSSNGQIISGQFGGPEYTAAPCDFDGDAITDPVVYREADGYWVGAASSRGYAPCWTSLGETGYQPVMADYDGDGLADPAVYNRTTGLWAIGLSGNGYQIETGFFGGLGYLSATADYDGDGLADPAIYAPDTAYWQVLMSGSLATQGGYTWWGGFAGSIGGIPVPADYDGDGKADLAVYHQNTGLWELFLSASGYQELSGLFGGTEYRPAKE